MGGHSTASSAKKGLIFFVDGIKGGKNAREYVGNNEGDANIYLYVCSYRYVLVCMHARTYVSSTENEQALSMEDYRRKVFLKVFPCKTMYITTHRHKHIGWCLYVPDNDVYISLYIQTHYTYAFGIMEILMFLYLCDMRLLIDR